MKVGHFFPPHAGVSWLSIRMMNATTVSPLWRVPGGRNFIKNESV
jgi:hypothetical protein